MAAVNWGGLLIEEREHDIEEERLHYLAWLEQQLMTLREYPKEE